MPNPQINYDADRSSPAVIRAQTRSRINEKADQLSREGVISDVTAVLVVGLASVVQAIAAGKDLAEIKAAVAPLEPMAAAVLTNMATADDLKDPASAIAAQKIVFPYMVKGDGSAADVMTDMSRLANGVSAALLSAHT